MEHGSNTDLFSHKEHDEHKGFFFVPLALFVAKLGTSATRQLAAPIAMPPRLTNGQMNYA